VGQETKMSHYSGRYTDKIMDINKLAQALSSSYTDPVDFGAKVNDTPENASAMQNVRDSAGLAAQGNLADRATRSVGVVTDERVRQEETARRRAQAQEEADLKKKIQEEKYKTNPDNYQAVINNVGGYAFFDPEGSPISAVEYARKTNQQITDIYKNSQDPNDEDFLNDYNLVTELGKAVQSGDADARDKLYEKNPNFEEEYHDKTYDYIVKDLHANYPGYFRSGQPSLNQGAVGQKASHIGSIAPNYAEPFDNRSKLAKYKDQIIPSFLGNEQTKDQWWE